MWIYLAIAIVAEVAATMSLRAVVDAPAWAVLTVVGYLLAFYFLSRTLGAGLPIGVAYGMWGALGVALTALLGWLIFAEAMSPLRMLGIGLVIVGVVLVEMGSKWAPRSPLNGARGA